MASIAGVRTASVRPLRSAIRTIRPKHAPFSTSLHKTSTREARVSQRALPSIASITRHSSTDASASTTSSNTLSAEILTWDRFFNLRRRRRYLNLASSIGTTVTTVAIAAPILAQQDLDTWASQVAGLDPIITLGLATMTIAGLGWISGPTFGNLFFSMWAKQKGWAQGIAEKEKSFYARIKRYRADPSSSSPQNPIPDYYGEKIASVKDYRRWLKDQKAFNLKKNKNML